MNTNMIFFMANLLETQCKNVYASGEHFHHISYIFLNENIKSNPFLKLNFIYLFIFLLQRGREKDRELKTSMREKHQSAASCTLPTGDVPATKVHALDWN
ncbi:unnamed protein product [Pipistrellus nathusii]|uniref:Uncharacterized protein n=1 Tax=Pipistrellus nathusii TaxID=59473 RepID=A0ABN9ZCN3_PIPNA